MISALKRYAHWLHTQWPAGVVEKLPRVDPEGTCNIPGVYIVGDLTGVPLLKFSADTGAKAVQHIASDVEFASLRQKVSKEKNILDLVVIGAGVSGISAALEAEKWSFDYQLLEATEVFSTIVNFPKGKPIYTYPTSMVPTGQLKIEAGVKEELVAGLKSQSLDQGVQPVSVRAERIRRRKGLLEVELAGGDVLRTCRVIIAIGRSGNFRKLGVPGEELDKVYNRLHDPQDFCEKHVLIVGGGDSALETAIALVQCGADVVVSYRKKEFSRPKPDNIEMIRKLSNDPGAAVEVETPVSERVTTASGDFIGKGLKKGRLRLLLGSKVQEIEEDSATILDAEGEEQRLENDVVFSMIGREAPLDFFRRSGIKIRGETVGLEWIGILIFFCLIWLVYDWKNYGWVSEYFPVLASESSFPKMIPEKISSLGDWWSAKVEDRSTLVGTIAVSMKSRSFYYTFVYTLCIGVFGIQRIRRRKTPYVKLQTSVLFFVQCIPLFLLPELILPWLGYNGVFDHGFLASVADNLFEPYISKEQYLAGDWPSWGHPRAYWRAYGLILAWPLMVYNVFTDQPMFWWLLICSIQTFVIIPALIYRWGKGAYCGWICSCGGLAETLGDAHRHKMPHGGRWNRLNMLGQAILLVAFALLVLRVVGWIWPGGRIDQIFPLLLEGKGPDGKLQNLTNYKWIVDVGLGGILGVGLYFKYSGRVWCRFACPLAALMHIYARFSRFGIVADKKKCISCNQCTSVCHQGIDIMNFANKGLPMVDPECVRCSACVQSCPTGVLQFGQINRKNGEVIKVDSLGASPVLLEEERKA